jgi:putative oxidoreductase
MSEQNNDRGCRETREAWDPRLIGGWKGFVKKLYAHHKPSGGALILRIALGSLFIIEGWTKIRGFAGTEHFFASIGFASPVWLWLVIIAELGGGLCILLGLLTKPACFALAFEMAIIVMGLPQPRGGLFNGHTYELFLLMALLSLYVGGPGKYSLARLWQNRKEKS